MDWLRSNGVTPVPVRFPGQSGISFSANNKNDDGDDESDYADVEDEDSDDAGHPHPEDTDEYEVTDEYLEFIAVTRKHQQDYKRIKSQRMRDERSTVYTDISTLAGPVTADDQDVRRNSNEKLMRRMQLAQWYGEAAGQEIGVIEDRMDQNFDEYVKKHHPSYFPACPIVMKGYFDNN